MKKLLLILISALALNSSHLQGQKTYYYYNETGYPVQVQITYTKSVKNRHSKQLEECTSPPIVIRGPSEQIKEPWAMRRVKEHCAIASIDATVKKDGKAIPATRLEYSLGLQGTAEFSVRETEKGSGKFAVVKYKE